MNQALFAKTAFGFVVVAFGIAAAACSSGSADGTAPGDEQDITGQKCGGNVADPQTCPTGYQCIANAQNPDLPGHCKKESGCVQNVICATSMHFDTTACKCVVNQCIQNGVCAINMHFDRTSCECVPNKILNGVLVTNACKAAGGSCVALSPGSCPSGHIGDARDYSCGAGLGVECCLP